MQLFFVKNIICKLIKFIAAKRQPRSCLSLLHIHHLAHHNLSCISNDIIHFPHPKHLIFFFAIIAPTTTNATVFATLVPVVILAKSIKPQVFFKNHLCLKQSHKNHLLMLPYFSLLFISCNKLITSLSPKKTIPLIMVTVSGIIKLANENSFLPYTS